MWACRGVFFPLRSNGWELWQEDKGAPSFRTMQWVSLIRSLRDSSYAYKRGWGQWSSAVPFHESCCQLALDDALKNHFERGGHISLSGSLQGGFIYSLSRKSDYQNQRLQWLLLWWQLVVLSDGEFPPEKNWGRLPHQRQKGQNQKQKGESENKTAPTLSQCYCEK